MHTSDYIYLILTIIGSLAGLTVAVAGLFAGIGYYKQGKNEAKSSDVDNANSTVKLFENRAKGLEEELKQLRSEFEAYKKETYLKEERYKRNVSQQEELVKTYAAILKNRNPELETVLKDIKQFLKDIRDSSKRTA